MKIAIIGAGFTGLAAGLKLTKAGYDVAIFEKNSSPGGLAIGFKDPKWQWSLEKHYHHWFTNDDRVLNLAKKINQNVIIKRPETSVYVNNKFYKLDSPMDVLRFPELNFVDRVRMGIIIAFLKYNPFWKFLERYKVSEFLPKTMGKKSYEILWKPLIAKKFGPYASDISLAWFWARIVKRTPSLAYPQEGYQHFINLIVSTIKKGNGKILLNNEVGEIEIQKDQKIKINGYIFDKVIVTIPSFSFAKITPQLPADYRQKLINFKGLAVVNLVLRLKKRFFKNSTYWLNVCEPKSPLTGIIEHTSFMDKKFYNNEYLVYLINYLPQDHPFIKKGKIELLRVYDPLLKKINKGYKNNIIDIYLFYEPFAQPIIPTNYSKLILPFETPLKNVYLANMQQVYPWDRGTNYAVDLGEKVAGLILKN